MRIKQEEEDEWEKIMAAAEDFDEERRRKLIKAGVRLPKRSPSLPKKSEKERVKEAMIIGLERKIDRQNVGYRLMSKMGYKDGMRLGGVYKGLVEPIKPVLKNNTKGLGKERADVEEFRRYAKDRREQDRKNRGRWQSSITNKQKVRRLQQELLKLRSSLDHLSHIHERGVVKDVGISYMRELHEWMQNPKTQRAKNPPLQWTMSERTVGPLKKKEFTASCVLAFGHMWVAKYGVNGVRTKGTGTTKKLAKQDCAFKILQQLYKAKIKKSVIKNLDQLSMGNPPQHIKPLEKEVDKILDRMRTKYYYCPYCEMQFQNLSSLRAGCPGKDKNLHGNFVDDDDFNDVY